MSDKPTKSRGRPTKFKGEYIQLAINYCRLGALNKDLAEYFGVSEQTIELWIRTNPEFKAAATKGKDEFNVKRAEGALIHAALGYTTKETKVFYDKDLGVVEHTIDKHYPPNTTALTFFLKNRDAGRWKETQTIDMDVDVDKLKQAFGIVDVGKLPSANIRPAIDVPQQLPEPE